MTTTLPWWRTATIYQIYPRSFLDTNGDGIGDLAGVIQKLDYIRDLGFDAIWLSPFFASPQEDFGYDISNYSAIAPEYGTLADVDNLLEAAHSRGLRVLFDLVMNHTSDQHSWFLESRSGRSSDKRAWYVWRDGSGSRPPNNWSSMVGGSAWHYDPASGQWYYAAFLPFQPDLNYRNPEVKQAMLDVARFWLDRGVDGFRLDIFHTIFEDESLRNNPPSIHYVPTDDHSAGFFQRWRHTVSQEETIAFARELRAVTNGYSPDRALLAEIFAADDTIRRYLGEDLDGLNLVFLWELLRSKPTARELAAVIRHHEAQYPEPYSPVYVYGNHDQGRLGSRIEGDWQLAKLMALLQFTVRGVTVTYYGEEIGMANGEIPLKQALDPLGRRYAWIPQWLIRLFNVFLNRDNCRTPMQWTDRGHAGFCPPNVTPWLPVNRDYPQINVRAQMSDGNSLLAVYRRLLHLRRACPPLQYGNLKLIDIGDKSGCLLFERKLNDATVLVAINFGRQAATLHQKVGSGQVLFAVGMEPPAGAGNLRLPPLSGVIFGAPSLRGLT